MPHLRITFQAEVATGTLTHTCSDNLNNAITEAEKFLAELKSKGYAGVEACLIYTSDENK